MSRVVHNNSTITSSSQDVYISIPIGTRQIDILISVGSVSGTSPTLQFAWNVDAVVQQISTFTLAGTVQTYQGASISTATTDAITISNNLIGDYGHLSWAVSGTSPSFGGVYSKIIFKK